MVFINQPEAFMKLSTLGCSVLIGLASFAAQADIIELKLAGDVEVLNDPEATQSVTKATAYVVLTTKDGLPEVLDYSALIYQDAILSIRFEFEDAQGLPVDLGVENPLELTDGAENAGNELSFSDGFDVAQFSFGYEVNDNLHFAQMIVAGSDDDRIADYTSNFVQLNPISAPESGVAGMFVTGSPQGDIYQFFIPDMSEVSYQVLLADADHDGIADELDACLTTDLSETVTLNGVNSGVANVLDSTGCSIMDHYAACDAEQSSGAGWLGYQGASYCETQVGYDLYREGLISYMELRLLRNALR
ncbi:hypothetical protein CWI80_03940 [Pseudidiomarina sediminum]|uniref:Uncharacterized protein n=2 Tax=Pseudidiomarina sediminum TaxID=431675 RepID=A0A432Z9G6_9GAMM|nr:hypothetical protein CWI80_03940 [Pseudidiomarina sediminum]